MTPPVCSFLPFVSATDATGVERSRSATFFSNRFTSNRACQPRLVNVCALSSFPIRSSAPLDVEEIGSGVGNARQSVVPEMFA